MTSSAPEVVSYRTKDYRFNESNTGETSGLSKPRHFFSGPNDRSIDRSMSMDSSLKVVSGNLNFKNVR